MACRHPVRDLAQSSASPASHEVRRSSKPGKHTVSSRPRSRASKAVAHAYDIRHLARLARHLDIPPHLLGLAPSSVDPPEPPVNRREFVSAAATAAAGAAMDAAFTFDLVRSRWLSDGHLPAVSMPDLAGCAVRE